MNRLNEAVPHGIGYRFRALLRLGLIPTILLISLLVALVALPHGVVYAASITVTTTDDELNEDGDCSLREAIVAANTDTAVDGCTAGSGADTITLPAGTYTLILEALPEDACLTGDLDITDDLTITGDGSGTTIIDASGLPIFKDRVFDIPSGVTAQIAGVTITGGQVGMAGYGGGIFNEGTLTLTQCVVSGNSAAAGGGVANGDPDAGTGGTLTLVESTVSDNLALTGGGISSAGTTASLTLTDSTVTDNASGGIYIDGGTASLTRSTVSWNDAIAAGGGIFISEGTLTIQDNSTVTGNSAVVAGGGICNGDLATGAGAADVTISGSTISGNNGGTFGGGIFMTGGTLTIENDSSVSTNTASGAGGGICNGDLVAETGTAGDVTITDSTISGNNSGQLGGGILIISGTLTIQDNSSVTANTAVMGGGGICNGDLLTEDSGSAGDVIISNSAVNDNDGGMYGGGLLMSGGTLTVQDNSSVTGNTAGMAGGGICNGDPSTMVGGGATITDSVLNDNDSGMGGAILSAGQLTIARSTLDGNGAPGMMGVGGGAILSGSSSGSTTATVTDCTITNNSVSAILNTSGTMDVSGSTISGSTGSGVVSFDGTLTLSACTISDNDATSATLPMGGGISVASGVATVSDCEISRNSALMGGGILNGLAFGGSGTAPTLAVTGSSIISNTAVYDPDWGLGGGGGVAQWAGSTTFTDCTISDNATSSPASLYSPMGGGGIFKYAGSLTLTGSTVSENSALGGVGGGGILNVASAEADTLELTNCTVSGNVTDQLGGGIMNYVGSGGAAASLLNATVTGNTAAEEYDVPILGWPIPGGGGIADFSFSGTAGIQLKNTIVADNLTGADCTEVMTDTITSLGNNLDSDGTCNLVATGDLANSNPLLGPLQDNGGPTLTHALLSGSPALDAADDTAAPATDQRGVPRPWDGNKDGVAMSDIGAFEYDPPLAINKLTNGSDADSGRGPCILVGEAVNWTYFVSNPGIATVDNITVSDNRLGAISCPQTSLDPGESMNCYASGTATPGQYSNTATTAGTLPGGEPVSDSDPSHYFGTDPSIDIEKLTNGEDADTPTGPEIIVGEPVEWTYVVTNTGNVLLSPVTVTDDQLGPGEVLCPLSFLLPGQYMTCAASGISEPGQHSNLATVTGAACAGPPVTDSDPSHYFGRYLADLSTTKSGWPDPAIAGGSLFYDLTVNNLGPQLALGALVTDTLPAEVTYVADSDDCALAGTGPSGEQILECPLGDMPPGASHSVQIKTRLAPDAVAWEADGTAITTNAAEAFTQSFDPQPANNATTKPILVQDEADLSVIKMSKPDITVRAGEAFTYTIFVDNLGPSYARDVMLRDDILSSGVFTITQVIADEQRAAACEVAVTNSITCTLDQPLEPWGTPDATGRWVITVQVRADESQDVNNLVEVFTAEGGTPDPDLSNNQAMDFIYVSDVANAWVVKDEYYCSGGPVGDPACFAGGQIEFRVDVGNEGPSTAENVVVEDFLPLGVTVLGVATSLGDGGSCTTGTPGDPFDPLTCNLGTIDVGASQWISVTARIAPEYGDPTLPYEFSLLANNAVVRSDVFDPHNSNNRDYVGTSVHTWSQVLFTKSGPDLAVAGEEMEYYATIVNYGPSTAHNFHFVDPLPQGVHFLDYHVGQGSGICFYHDSLPLPFAGPGVHCYVGDIAPGNVTVVHLRTLLDPNITTEQVCNSIPTGEVPGWDADSYVEVIEGSEFEWCTGVETVADLSVQKTADPPKLYPGEQLNYQILVTNEGPSTAQNVIVTDTLPSPSEYEIATASCQLLSESPDVLECQLGAMQPAEVRQFGVWARVSDGAPPDTITNTVTVGSGTLDPFGENDTAEASTLVLNPNAADLALSKGVQAGPYIAGTDIAYTLVVNNRGPRAAQNVVLEDTLPTAVTVLDTQPTQGSCTTNTPGSGPLVCSLGELGVGGSARVQISVRIDPAYIGELGNDAVVYSDLFDPQNGDNRASVIITVEPNSDVAILKSDAPDPVLAGEVLYYTLAVANGGPSTARQVGISDTLPDGVTYLGYELGGGSGTCAYTMQGSDAVVACSLGDMAPYDGRSVVIRVRVHADTPHGALLTNTAYAEPFGGIDPNLDNNESSTETTVNNQADLSVGKTSTPWQVFAGEQLTYDISVTNHGPGNADAVVITDTLPSGVELELATDPGCEHLDGQVRCAWDMLSVDETRSFHIFARVLPDTEPGVISNEVIVETASFDPTEYNDRDTAANLVQGKADLKITKYGKPHGEVRAGQVLTYTVIVDNLGPGFAHDVVVSDEVVSSGTFTLLGVDSSRDGWSCSQETGTFESTLSLTCRLDDPLEVMTPDSSGRWVLTFHLMADEPQSINNVASVASADLDPDESNNQAMAEHEITAVSDLALVKTSLGEVVLPQGEAPGECDEIHLLPDEVTAGLSLTYTLTITNAGPSTAENVVLRDQRLPLWIEIANVTPSDGTCNTALIDAPERLLTCTLGTLAPGESATVIVNADVPSWLEEGTRLMNDALVYSDVFDDDNGNNLASDWTTVEVSADLGVQKSQEPEITLPGLETVYTIRVDNLGPSDAHGVLISDTLPFTPTIMSVEGCASDGGQCDVPCEVPTCPAGECPWPDVDFVAQADIPTGEYVIYTLTAIPQWVPCEMITNTVQVVADYDYEHDIDPCDENDFAYTVSDPECNFVPLVLKNYPGSDSPP